MSRISTFSRAAYIFAVPAFSCEVFCTIEYLAQGATTGILRNYRACDGG
jgi:hypothetical protein